MNKSEALEAALAEAAETGVFWGRVDRPEQISPTMARLLDILPPGTRVYLRVRRSDEKD